MAHLIDKDAVMAIIKKHRSMVVGIPGHFNESSLCNKILVDIDTLEMKEVDLEKEMDKEWNKCEPIDEGMGLEIASIEHEQFDNIAKHFFELGLKAQKGEKV